MKKVLLPVLFLALPACDTLFIPHDDSIPRINSQADADAYNATVSAERDKLVCTRERVMGSNMPELVCLTVAQRERLNEHAREVLSTAGQ